MILVPQCFLRNGKIALRGGPTSPLFEDDPIETAKAMKLAGAEKMHIVDLGVPHVGASPHLPIIQAIRETTGMSLFVSGPFRTPHAVESMLKLGIEFIVLDSIAYQQPAFLQELCKSFPAKIGAHIDMKGGHVTIPGYTVVAHKTALEYAERFLESGVRYILYSDIQNDGSVNDENFARLLDFCRKATARIYCTSDVRNLKEIEAVVKLGAPRLEGMILSKSLEEDRIDLRSAIVMVSDLTIGAGLDETLAEI